MKDSFSKTLGRFYPILAPFGALLLTLVAFYYTSRSIASRELTSLRNDSSQIEHQFSFRMQTYINALIHTKGLFYLTHHVGQREFQDYVSALNLLTEYPGIQGLGYTERIPESEVHKRGVWPKDKRDIYFAIVYLEPLDWRNQRAIGYDMFTDPDRREAMGRARDTGLPSMTGRVTLVQETKEDPQPGFLLYVPLYTGPVIPPSLEERRKSLRGFVYAPFRSRDLFFHIMKNLRHTNDLEFRVGFGELASDDLLYESSPGARPRNPYFLEQKKIKLAGKELVLETFTPNWYRPESKELPYVLLLMGSFLSLAIFWVIRKEQVQARENERLFRESNEALQARDEFLSIASHELKTPVTSMKLQFQLAQKQLDRKDPKALALETVTRRVSLATSQLNKINKLVEDMLETSRFTAKKLKLEQRPIELNVLVQDIIEVHTEQIREHQVEVRKKFSPAGLTVNGDAFRLEQVFTNLLTNALKYGKGKPIEVTTWREGDYVLVSFRDFGMGIPEEHLSKIFQRFERAVRGNAISGLGLGFYISNQIVLAHGGKIIVESVPEEGSVFTVYLPAQ